MIGKHHAIVAAASWAAVYSSGAAGTATGGVLPGLAVATGAGLLPDIDEDGSIVSQALGPVGWALSKVIGAVAGGHRGATHTIPAALLVAGLVLLATRSPNLAAAAFVGYLSHLVGDTLTPMGVPWLWPVRSVDDRFSLNLFTTGTYIEVLAAWGWVAACLFAIFRTRTGSGPI